MKAFMRLEAGIRPRDHHIISTAMVFVIMSPHWDRRMDPVKYPISIEGRYSGDRNRQSEAAILFLESIG